MSADDLVLAGVEDGIAGILLNRPSWSPGLRDAYHSALADAADDPDVRAIVVTGSDGTFCSAGPGPVSPSRLGSLHPLSIGKPVIAAIGGECSGEPLLEVLLCAIRFASTAASFNAPWARLGLPAPDAAAWLLTRLIGVGAAVDMLISGRGLDAGDAAGIGLVQDVFEPEELMESTLAYARRIVETTQPEAVAAIKAQVYRTLELGLAAAIEEANALAEGFTRSRPG